MARITLSLVALMAVVFGATSTAQANTAQYHILNTGTNLGWVDATLELEGMSAANRGAVGTSLANAVAHLGALLPLIQTPYSRTGFEKATRQIAALARKIGALSPAKARSELSKIRSLLRQSLRVYLSARTRRLEVADTCDSEMLEVGYQFGRGQIAGQRSKARIQRAARALMLRAIVRGEAAAKSLGCGFPGSSFRALSMMSSSTPGAYTTSLEPMQNAAWDAGGNAAPFPGLLPAAALPGPFATPALPGGPIPAIRPGEWYGKGGFKKIRLAGNSVSLRGTYSSTWKKKKPGYLTFSRVTRGGPYTGTWGEEAVKRHGIMTDIEVSADGKKITLKWKNTIPGTISKGLARKYKGGKATLTWVGP